VGQSCLQAAWRRQPIAILYAPCLPSKSLSIRIPGSNICGDRSPLANGEPHTVPIASMTGSWVRCMHACVTTSGPVTSGAYQSMRFLRASRDSLRPETLSAQDTVYGVEAAQGTARPPHTLLTCLQQNLQDALPLRTLTQRHHRRAGERRTRGRMISIIVVSLRNFLKWCFFLLAVEQWQHPASRSGQVASRRVACCTATSALKGGSAANP
jgi:hypothetical protein